MDLGYRKPICYKMGCPNNYSKICYHDNCRNGICNKCTGSEKGVRFCYFCGEYACNDHLKECVSCAKIVCHGCHVYSCNGKKPFLFNTELRPCKFALCAGCVHKVKDYGGLCDSCGKYYCNDETFGCTIDGCGAKFCNNCTNERISKCDICDEYHCSSHGFYCGHCPEEILCPKQRCDNCGISICDNCAILCPSKAKR